MQKNLARFLVVVGLTLITGCFIAWISFEKPLQNKVFFDFPMNIGGWRGKEVAMSDYVYQGIETKYLFLRNYYSEKYTQPVNLSIVWFDDRNIAFHAPEECLGGIGINVEEKKTVRIKIHGNYYNIGKLVVNFNRQKELVYYYFDVDGYITTSQSSIRLHVLGRRLCFKRASISFIRVMTPIETNETKTSEILTGFIKTIYTVIPSYTYTDLITK